MLFNMGWGKVGGYFFYGRLIGFSRRLWVVVFGIVKMQSVVLVGGCGVGILG